MKKILLLLCLLLSHIDANNTLNEEALDMINNKGLYHQFITKEYELAKKYHETGCEANYAISCDNLGTLYLNGDATHKSKPLKALTYYQKSCDLNNAYGCLMSANLSSEIIKTIEDLTATINYYKKGCTLGMKQACEALNSDKTNIRCTRAHINTCNEIGIQFGKTGQYTQTLYFGKQSCSLENGLGCYLVGLLYLHGLEVAKNLDIAKQYIQKSCAYGYVKGCQK